MDKKKLEIKNRGIMKIRGSRGTIALTEELTSSLLNCLGTQFNEKGEQGGQDEGADTIGNGADRSTGQ